MLTRLAIFNSQKHAKVVVRFDDATSMQIIGENKIGKTTLIDTLNFLYIIDPHKMSFDNRKYTFKESVNHFFPSHSQSFIIFECFKAKAGGYMCILVKRKLSEDNVEYYRIDKHFDETDYLKAGGELKRFDEIKRDLAIENYIQPIKDKNELFQLVYNQDTSKRSFVWINEKVKRNKNAHENSLSKIYLYLFNASLIDDHALREALIIADNRQNDVLNVFTDKGKLDTVEKLKSENQYLETLKRISPDFEDFKYHVNLYERKKKLVGELYYSFHQLISSEIGNIGQKISDKTREYKFYVDKKNQLDTDEKNIFSFIGGINQQINQKNEQIMLLQKQLERINNFLYNTSPLHGTVESLTAHLQEKQIGLQQQFDIIEQQLQSVKQYKRTQEQVNAKLQELNDKQKSLANKINHYENLLLHNISDDEHTRNVFYSIFSKEFTSKLTKNDLGKKITSFSDVLTINTGKIKNFEAVVANLKISKLESVTELQQQLQNTLSDIKEQEDLLSAIKDRAGKEAQRNKLKKQIEECDDIIRTINQKEETEQNIDSRTQELQALQQQLQQKNIEQRQISADLMETSNIATQCHELRERLVNELRNYNDWASEFNDNTIVLVENLIEKPLGELRVDLKREMALLNEQKSKKQSLFDELKRQTNSMLADEREFINQINQDIITIQDKEKSLEILLEQISKNFTEPVNNFLNRYDDFKRFIKKFNDIIAQYQISDLSSLRIVRHDNETLIDDLQKIGKIIRIDDFKADLFNQFNSREQQEYLKVLEEYIKNRNKLIDFKELFDISLIATDEKGNKKTIDFRKLNESTGTIRMIILILFLLVIKYFKVDDKENKLVFFIDEDVIDLPNMTQLFKFCNENGFVVIFAAKHQIVGLEKYYFIKKSAQHNNKVFLDERNVVFAKKK